MGERRHTAPAVKHKHLYWSMCVCACITAPLAFIDISWFSLPVFEGYLLWKYTVINLWQENITQQWK